MEASKMLGNNAARHYSKQNDTGANVRLHLTFRKLLPLTSTTLQTISERYSPCRSV